MFKILIIARREYLAMVATKAFLITLALMPLLMMGGAIAPQLLRGRVDLDGKQIVVLDGTGRMFPLLKAAADAYNTTAVNDPESGKQVEAKLHLRPGPEGPVDDALRAELSEQIRSGELYAFVELPANLLDMPSDMNSVATVTFHAENAPLSRAKRWLEATVTRLVQAERLQTSQVDPQLVLLASLVTVEAGGLYERSSDGAITTAGPQDELTAIFLPLGFMMFMFLVIMMSAQPMLESVLEEKTNRIAEVLLGSSTPTQLMYGKLLGNVAGSLTVVVIYLSGGLALAAYNNSLDMVPLRVVPWFVLFQVLAVVMFSSLFLAIGSSVNHLKEAQGLLMPVWIVVAAPMFVWFNIVTEPNGSLASTMSLIPVFTPMLMTLRMACSESVPLWQPALGTVLTLATTAFCVFAAGRIFRIGVLAQGKAPKLTQLARWVFSG